MAAGGAGKEINTAAGLSAVPTMAGKLYLHSAGLAFVPMGRTVLIPFRRIGMGGESLVTANVTCYITVVVVYVQNSIPSLVTAVTAVPMIFAVAYPTLTEGVGMIEGGGDYMITYRAALRCCLGSGGAGGMIYGINFIAANDTFVPMGAAVGGPGSGIFMIGRSGMAAGVTSAVAVVIKKMGVLILLIAAICAFVPMLDSVTRPIGAVVMNSGALCSAKIAVCIAIIGIYMDRSSYVSAIITISIAFVIEAMRCKSA